MLVVVTCAVAEGEELLVDYGPAYWPPEESRQTALKSNIDAKSS